MQLKFDSTKSHCQPSCLSKAPFLNLMFWGSFEICNKVLKAKYGNPFRPLLCFCSSRMMYTSSTRPYGEKIWNHRWKNSWGFIATLGAYEANNLLQRGGLNLYVWLVEHGNRRGNRWINYIMHQEAAEPLNTSVNNNLLYTRGINQPLKQLYFQVQPQFTSTSCSYKNGLSLLLQFLFPMLACWENPQTTYAPQHLRWVQ